MKVSIEWLYSQLLRNYAVYLHTNLATAFQLCRAVRTAVRIELTLSLAVRLGRNTRMTGNEREIWIFDGQKEIETLNKLWRKSLVPIFGTYKCSLPLYVKPTHHQRAGIGRALGGNSVSENNLVEIRQSSLNWWHCSNNNNKKLATKQWVHSSRDAISMGSIVLNDFHIDGVLEMTFARLVWCERASAVAFQLFPTNAFQH